MNAIAKTPYQLIDSLEKRFGELNVIQNVAFSQEQSFAKQILGNNDFLMGVAANNKPSLASAVLNVAMIGLTLNPAKKHAYLVPRDGKVCLDISYQGLVKLATDCGAIQWAKAELVYSNDKFELNGATEEPTHTRDPFSKERGDIVGAYCLAKLSNGDFMTTAMSLDEIKKIQDTSKAAGSKFSPWVTFWEEMAKKTVIKRGSKSWPQSDNRDRWDAALECLNEAEGVGFTLKEYSEFMELMEAAEADESKAADFFIYIKGLSETAYYALYNSAEKGQKTAFKQRISKAEKLGAEQFNAMTSSLFGIADAQDEGAILEIAEEYPSSLDIIAEFLNPRDAEYFLTIAKMGV